MRSRTWRNINRAAAGSIWPAAAAVLIVLLRENEGIFGGPLKQLCVFE